jgi:hypothetical protein
VVDKESSKIIEKGEKKSVWFGKGVSHFPVEKEDEAASFWFC